MSKDNEVGSMPPYPVASDDSSPGNRVKRSIILKPTADGNDKGPSTKYDNFMRVSMEKNGGNEKTSTKGPSTKYDHVMRHSMDKNGRK